MANEPEQHSGTWGTAVNRLADPQRQKNLMRWLDWRWQHDYVCFSGDGEYSATRLDNEQTVVAGSAFELARKMDADYRARPVDRSAVPALD